MLHFNYTLDNELEVPVGRLPSGIQTQAFEMAIERMGRKFRSSLRMLMTPVAGFGGKTPLDGMSPGWQARIKAESAFMGSMPAQLQQRARLVALSHSGNAVNQGALEQDWNRWSALALQTYGEALDAFQKDVSQAMRNAAAQGAPAVFTKLAALAKVSAPRLSNVKTLGGLGRLPTGVDDPDYLAGLGASTSTLLGVGLVGLAAWYLTRAEPNRDRYAMVPPSGVGYYLGAL